MRLLLTFLFVPVFVLQIAAQDSLVFLKTIPASGLEKASMDNYGHLYISDKSGNIQKYDSAGQFLLRFSPQKLGRVTLLEAWNTVRIFIFYRDFQEYAILERFLGPTGNSALNANEIGFARQVTLASDYNLWVLDETDFSLKKYDRQFGKVLNKTSLDLLLDLQDYDITFLREYQNALYVCDRNSGLLVFDAFGSYKKKIPLKGLSSFSFAGDELYYLKNDSLSFFHLYLFSLRTIALPKGNNYLTALLHHRTVYAIRPDGIDLYRLETAKGK